LSLKVAFPTDEHFPFQDEKAREVALKIVRDFNPDVMPAGSDGLDFYRLSKFDRDPSRMKSETMQTEFDMWSRGQREWKDAAPNAKRQWIPGNHEFRFQRELWKTEFSSLRALEFGNVLELEKLGIDSTPVDEIDLGALLIRHGEIVRANSAYSARGELEKQRFQISTLTGHTHRGGMFMTTGRGRTLFGVEGFCLCKLDPWYGTGPYDWQQGIVLVTIHLDDVLQFEQIPFSRKLGKVVAHWRDKEYLA
jgi:hypothetical protein